MNYRLIASLLAPVILGAWGPSAAADSSRAECEFYHHGDHKKQDSGPCQVSQRSGYVTIRLASGKEFELKPANKPHRYHDQKGDDVRLQDIKSGSSTYKWDHKRIEVRWDQGMQQSTASYNNDSIPPSLRDLMGASARNLDNEMRRRNYASRSGWVDGDTRYTAWQEQENGTCVSVGVSNGRVATIGYANASDCHR